MDEPKKPQRKKAAKILHCSFCNKPQNEVRSVIARITLPATLAVAICNECVDMCNLIISDEEASRATESPEAFQAYISGQQAAIRTLIDHVVATSAKFTGHTPTVSDPASR